MFDEVDEDKGGTLDREEIHTLAVKLLGRVVKAPEVDRMMKEMDEDGGGDVDFEENSTRGLRVQRRPR